MIEQQIEVVAHLFHARIEGAVVAEGAGRRRIEQHLAAEVRLDRRSVVVILHVVTVDAAPVQLGNRQDLDFRILEYSRFIGHHRVLLIPSFFCEDADGNQKQYQQNAKREQFLFHRNSFF